MAEKLAGPRELRAQATEHRKKALKIADSQQRRMRLDLAREYDRLADAIEGERGTPRGGDTLLSYKLTS